MLIEFSADFLVYSVSLLLGILRVTYQKPMVSFQRNQSANRHLRQSPTVNYRCAAVYTEYRKIEDT